MKVLRQGTSFTQSVKRLHRMKICPKSCFICERNRETAAAKKAARKATKIEGDKMTKPFEQTLSECLEAARVELAALETKLVNLRAAAERYRVTRVSNDRAMRLSAEAEFDAAIERSK